jgi:hypothetical protein
VACFQAGQDRDERPSPREDESNPALSLERTTSSADLSVAADGPEVMPGVHPALVGFAATAGHFFPLATGRRAECIEGAET